MKDKESVSYPIRLNRYLALQGLATRRGGDELIAAGLVTIDGQVAKLGDKVESASQRVELSRDAVHGSKQHSYLAYYKPRGIITHSPQRNEREIADVSGYPDLFPVGRLDKDSEGLILLTDDGRVTERLLHPRFAHEKEYAVVVRERIPSNVRRILEEGVESEGERLTAREVRIIGPNQLSIILTEGKKHEIRRMLDSVHLTVERLVRVRIMNIRLGSLKIGELRPLVGRSREAFLHELGIR